ncbi:hypothetical protein C0995_000108 [Termitomyces sp. Mi166|nr:hypothetical protein C0995_000108 [Termitomyces sp. Mi166\
MTSTRLMRGSPDEKFAQPLQAERGHDVDSKAHCTTLSSTTASIIHISQYLHLDIAADLYCFSKNKGALRQNETLNSHGDEHDYEREILLAHASNSWPPPPFVPPNWSCTWSEWEGLVTFYWLSSYYLMLPQVEMHVNIQYGIRGQTRPILFSNERDAFVFTIVDSNEYFLFDGCFSALFRIKDVCNDHELVELMAQGDDALVERFEDLEESEEGLSVIQRILERDETVIPLLAEKFLHYTPVTTTPGMESTSPVLQEEEIVKDMESRDLDDELRKLDEEMGRLKDDLNSLLDGNQSKEETEGLMEGADEEEGMRLMREQLAKFGNVTVTEVASEKDIPHEELERVKKETKTLKEGIDDILKEMEVFTVEPHQEQKLKRTVAAAKALRERLDEMSLVDGHAMAHYLAQSLEQNLMAIKNDPKAIDS